MGQSHLTLPARSTWRGYPGTLATRRGPTSSCLSRDNWSVTCCWFGVDLQVPGSLQGDLVTKNGWVASGRELAVRASGADGLGCGRGPDRGQGPRRGSGG